MIVPLFIFQRILCHSAPPGKNWWDPVIILHPTIMSVMKEVDPYLADWVERMGIAFLSEICWIFSATKRRNHPNFLDCLFGEGLKRKYKRFPHRIGWFFFSLLGDHPRAWVSFLSLSELIVIFHCLGIGGKNQINYLRRFFRMEKKRFLGLWVPPQGDWHRQSFHKTLKNVSSTCPLFPFLSTSNTWQIHPLFFFAHPDQWQSEEINKYLQETAHLAHPSPAHFYCKWHSRNIFQVL